jgi:hypothetical protein
VVSLVVSFEPDRRPFSSVEGLAMTARRTLLVVTAAALAATSVHLALARWAAGELTTLAWEGWREEALDLRLAATRRVMDGKARVVAEVIAGRLTLLEATGRFRELNVLVENADDHGVLAPYRVVTGEEALCRTVLAWVEAELWYEPDQAAAPIRARLKAEYRQQFGHDPQPLPAYAPLPLSPAPRRAAAPSPAASMQIQGTEGIRRQNRSVQPTQRQPASGGRAEPALPPSACPPCDPGPANAV